jgi:hypothetical protein
LVLHAEVTLGLQVERLLQQQCGEARAASWQLLQRLQQQVTCKLQASQLCQLQYAAADGPAAMQRIINRSLSTGSATAEQ